MGTRARPRPSNLLIASAPAPPLRLHRVCCVPPPLRLLRRAALRAAPRQRKVDGCDHPSTSASMSTPVALARSADASS
eukprot:6195912-Pleurochrysis_carterae.AAC.1